MGRSGYCECLEPWSLICWRGAVTSAIRGKRGQAFLKELRDALDALPEKKLISDELEHDGAVCALGALGKKRGIDMSKVDSHDNSSIAATFNIPHSLACEIMFENDEGVAFGPEPAEFRFDRMRRWIDSLIKE